MSTNLNLLITDTDFNSFKNNSTVYRGSLTFTGTLTSAQQLTVTSSVTLNEQPVFSLFFANFTEVIDLTQFPNGTYGNAQWYPIDVGAFSSAGVWITAPLANQGVVGAVIYPVINGNTLTVTGYINNPYNNSVTLGATTISYAFANYTLAN